MGAEESKDEQWQTEEKADAAEEEEMRTAAASATRQYVHHLG